MADWYEKRTLGSLPDGMAHKLPHREALVFEARRFTFAEVVTEVDRAAKALIALGVRPGDHVCLWLNNCDDWLFIRLFRGRSDVYAHRRQAGRHAHLRCARLPGSGRARGCHADARFRDPHEGPQ